MRNVRYEQLLLEAGGGIIDAASLSPQPDCATVAIGLGGTGIDALRRLKTKVYTRVRPDDPDAAVPAYSRIRFLAVDSDVVGMRHQGDYGYCHVGQDDALGRLDLQREFFDISYSGSISQLFKEQRVLLAKDPCYSEWLQFDEIEAASADDGAGGIRQLGRFLLFQHASDFVDKVKSVIQSALMDFGTTSVYVHIFSGLSGDTGSGTFLDVCYLVRYAINQLGGLTPKIMGYFFLPDVSLRPGFGSDQKAYLKANGYAAMQELDYCMGFEDNGDLWHQEYPDVGLVESRKQPVDLCHIVSATTVGGVVRDNAYDHALNVVTEAACDCLFGEDSTLPKLGPVAHPIMDEVPCSTGAINGYLTLGAASAVVPHTRIMTYLAAGALRGLPKLLGQTPKEGEGIDFGRAIGLTYDQVYQRVTSQANMSFPMPDVKAEDAQANERLVISDWFVKMETDTEGRIAANVGTLTKHLGSYSASESGNAQAGQLSLMAALLRGLREAMADPQRGPAWAAKMVAGGGGYDIIAQLNGIKASARGKLDHENFNLNEKPDNYYTLQQSRQTAFRAAGFFGRGKAYNKFLGATQTLVQSQARVAAYEGVIRVVDELVPQVRALASEFAQPFRDCIARLDATFQADAQYLDSFADGASRYETPIVTMAQVRPSLDEALRGVDGEAVERELLGRLLADSGMAAWGPAGDDQKLAHIVSAYFLERFHEFSTRSITEYLEERYHTTNQQQLSNAIFNDLLTKVNSDAEPLFWNEVGYNTDNASHFEYVTVPNTAPAVAAAAARLVAIPDVRRAPVMDRISVLRVIMGVPLWGYAGTALFETATDTPGRHLYQPANRVEGIEPPASRNWNLLPSPTPWTVMYGHEKDSDKGTYVRAEDAVALFQEGLDRGVLGFANSRRDLCVHIMTDDFMQGIRVDYERGKGCTQETDRIAWRDKIQAMDQDRVYEDQLSSPCLYRPYDLTCYLGDYFVDVFVRSPVIQSVVRRELAKVEEIQGYIEELSPREDADLDDICTALFTGVVKFASPREPVTYTDEWGDETMLSNKRMDRGGAPLYQVYLSYKGIAEAKKEEIRAKSNEIVNADELPEDEVLAVCRAVREELKHSPDRLAFIKEKYPAEARECEEVLQGMAKRLDSFLVQNMIEL